MYVRVPPRLGRISLAVLALTLAFSYQLTAKAQADQGRIVGTVTDATGAIVPGATVVVKNERTGEERTATTNEAGYFVVLALKPSTYSISVSAQSLTIRASGVQLLVGQELNLPLTLQATGVEAKVDVSMTGDTAMIPVLPQIGRAHV